MGGAVARLAEAAYARLDPVQQLIVRRILLRLAGDDAGGGAVRRQVSLEELEADRDGTSATCSPAAGSSRPTPGRWRSGTRPCCASGRGCAAGSRTTRRAGDIRAALRLALPDVVIGYSAGGQLALGPRRRDSRAGRRPAGTNDLREAAPQHLADDAVL